MKLEIAMNRVKNYRIVSQKTGFSQDQGTRAFDLDRRKNLRKLAFDEDFWVECETFPRYAVSPSGLIKNQKTDRLMSINFNKQGFAMVSLQGEDGRQKTRSVALLVARAFLPPPKNDFYNSVIHLDGDRSNFNANNLMWRPGWYARKYHSMFSLDPKTIAAHIEDTNETFSSLRELCTTYGLYEPQTFVDAWNGHTCFHYNYTIFLLRE